MSQGNKLKFQRGAAANTEFEDRNKGAENRHHNRDGMAARKNLQGSKEKAPPENARVEGGAIRRRGRTTSTRYQLKMFH
jgi:hypothetical protein